MILLSYNIHLLKKKKKRHPGTQHLIVNESHIGVASALWRYRILVRYISKEKHPRDWAPSINRERRSLFDGASSYASFYSMPGVKVATGEQIIALLKPTT